jgi:mannose-6-phosphate isomerase-like protein (cupin superfamily)
MPQPGDTYDLHDAERVTVRSHTAALLEVEARWLPAPAGPLAHRHPHQAERFAVQSGELSVELDGTTRVLRAGDELEIPQGAAHRMFNSGDEPAVATWQTRPALRTAEFWRDMDAARRTRPTDAHGMLTPVAAGPLLHGYRDVFQIAWPAPVRTAVLAALRVAARLKGYR